ncbi:MAG: condensation domain-containing protein, partial [Bradymonadaceae bacterium]
MRRAVLDVVEDHEVLRSTFHSEDGRPIQRVHGARESLQWEVVDLREASDWKAAARERLAEWTATPFELSEQTPVRFRLLEGPDGDAVFAAIFHHIATDEWSSEPFWESLETCYRARCSDGRRHPEPPTISFLEYARNRHERPGGDPETSGLAREGEADYWSRRLRGARSTVDWPAPQRPDREVTDPTGRVTFRWDEARTDALERACRDLGVSPFFVLTVGFAASLAHRTGQRDLTVGVPVTNRRRPALEETIGFFLNPLPFRLRWTPEESLRELIDRVWSDWRRLFTNPEVSVDAIASEFEGGDRSGATPLFDVMLTAVPPHGPPDETFGPHDASPFGPSFPYLGVGEPKCTLNAGIELGESDLRGCFVFDRRELDASWVRELVETFEHLVASIVDSSHQPFRAFLDETAEAARSGSLASVAAPRSTKLVEIADALADAPPPETTPADPDGAAPMYTLYTSGTTGRPKGVVVPHRAVANHVRWLQQAYQLDGDDVVLLKSSYGFDMSVSELFGPLAAGATVAVAPPGADRDPRRLIELARAFEVTGLRAVPTTLDLLLEDPRVEDLEETLNWVALGGEALSRPL